ncbi:zf-HC2 domain-containing protein [Longispora albida]|uniref:zf-HC2 domain-containing protein n=1 Tax=Longispora albida TaxID=203523 RepID=UPI0003632D71|nr:zf-HC2 domain-containing protein [Longispora albida]
MNCGAVRAALSAHFDGEAAELSAEQTAAHLSGCAACREWKLRAEQVNRMVAVPVQVPDLTERVLAAVIDQERAARRARWQILRIAVGAAAVIQLLLALPVLLDGGAGPHASREMASFDIALAVGFLLAAWQPARARAFVPVAAVLAFCFALTSSMDVLNDSTALAHETGHLVALVQAGLLWALGRTSAAGTGAPATVRP